MILRPKASSISSLTKSIPLLVLAVGMAWGGSAEAKPKVKKKAVATACGIRYLPFTTGRTWKYQFVIPPNASEKEVPLKTKVPETFSITVKSVDSSGATTAITLEESYRDTTIETVLTCSGSKLSVPLTSFFYLGELPGGLGMEISDLNIDGPMYPGKNGLKKGVSYFAKIEAKVARKAMGGTSAKHGQVSIEMERQLTVGSKEKVEVDYGAHSAYPVEFALSGRVSLSDSSGKKVFLPDGVAKLWFADGVGVVRAYNRMDQGWALVEMTDTK